jgi:hypothetical protein
MEIDQLHNHVVQVVHKNEQPNSIGKGKVHPRTGHKGPKVE